MLKAAVQSLGVTFFPATCRLCYAPLLQLSRLPVCQNCIASIEPVSAVTCAVCGEALGTFAAPESALICGLCRRAGQPFDRAYAFAGYDGALRGLIHLLKYELVMPASEQLGAMLAQALAADAGRATEPTLVIPVPLHRTKQRQRGFNQAEWISRAALKHPMLKRVPGYRLHLGNLERIRETGSQTGLTRHQRRANVRGAFVLRDPEKIAGRRVLIVDDVYTTGTTLSECARVVRRAGAKEVFAASVARVYRTNAAPVVLERREETAAASA